MNRRLTTALIAGLIGSASLASGQASDPAPTGSQAMRIDDSGTVVVDPVLAMRWQPGMNLSGLLNACNEMLAEPLPFEWSNQTPRFLLIFTGLYAVIVLAASSEHRNTRPGEEHGAARGSA